MLTEHFSLCSISCLSRIFLWSTVNEYAPNQEIISLHCRNYVLVDRCSSACMPYNYDFAPKMQCHWGKKYSSVNSWTGNPVMKLECSVLLQIGFLHKYRGKCKGEQLQILNTQHKVNNFHNLYFYSSCSGILLFLLLQDHLRITIHLDINISSFLFHHPSYSPPIAN